MEHLIQMALADGELTEKEKQVLFKKAEAQGIDLDEFEMVLDARLYERQKAMQAAAPMAHDAAPNSNKYGDVRKCPGCGAIVESFTTRCPDCGHEFKNVESVVSISNLFEKLESLEAQKVYKQRRWGEDIDNSDEIDYKKANIIRTFPIPTTKEDILEFLSMAAPLGKKKGFFASDESFGEEELRKAWREKCEQVIIKARFSMRDDKKILEEIEGYARQLKIK